MIEKESWKIIELIIRRYPDKQREYEEYISNIMTSTSAAGIITAKYEDYSRPQSVTEAKALKMTDKRMERMKHEIEAVKLVYDNLEQEEQKVMRARFWTDRDRNIPYTKIENVNYSERQMKRIIKKIIIQVGIYIGEIS